MLKDLALGILETDTSFRFTARGWSMSPFIRDRDVITVAPLRGETLRPGDTALLLHPGGDRLLVHRVVGVEGGAFLVRGDGANAPDGPIPAARILGRVSAVERRGRRVRLGQGPERLVIAMLSRNGVLVPLVRIAARLKRLVAPRSAAA